MTTCNVLGGGWGHAIACKKKINIQLQYLKDYACILMQPSPVKLVEKGAEVQEHNQLVEHRLRLVLQEAFVTRNKTCLAHARAE